MRTDELAKQILAGEYVFCHGEHEYPRAGMCVMEAAAYVAGEEHSDSPKCIPSWVRDILVSWNDCLRSGLARQRALGKLLPKILGTGHTCTDEESVRAAAIKYAEEEILKLKLGYSDYGVHCSAETVIRNSGLGHILTYKSGLRADLLYARLEHLDVLTRIAQNTILILCGLEPCF